MKGTGALRYEIIAIGSILCLLAVPAFAGVSFFDGTLASLSNDGTPQVWSSNPSVVTSIQQITSGGNPGDAPADQPVVSGWHLRRLTGIDSQRVSYEPGTQGALTSISSSDDKFIHIETQFDLKGSNIRALILRGGNYYVWPGSVDPQLDMWISGVGTLGAGDFGLLNFSDGLVDFGVHPNFDSGVMQLGMTNEFSVELDGPTDVTIDYDNSLPHAEYGDTRAVEPAAIGDGRCGLGRSDAKKEDGEVGAAPAGKQMFHVEHLKRQAPG
jgi:hypothetical protein